MVQMHNWYLMRYEAVRSILMYKPHLAMISLISFRPKCWWSNREDSCCFLMQHFHLSLYNTVKVINSILHNTFVVSQETSAIIVIFTFSLHFLCQQFSCFLLTHILFSLRVYNVLILRSPLISVFMQIKERYCSEEVS